MKTTRAIQVVLWTVLPLMVWQNLGQAAGGYLKDQDAQQAYDQLKELEKQIPWPTNTATVEMGTFYVNRGATGAFFGVQTTNASAPVIVKTDGLYVTLAFRVEPHGLGPYQVLLGECTVKGSHYRPPQEVSVPATNDRIIVNVGLADHVRWSVTAVNNKGAPVSHSDTFVLQRIKPYYACGAFLVPALPVALIYAPPQDGNNKNVVSYTVSQSVGTTMDATVSREDSTTSPSETGFGDLNKLRSGIGALAGAVKNVPVVSTLVQAFNSFLNGLGNETATATGGRIEVQGNSLSLMDTFTETSSTLPGQGPGHGDLVIIKKNALIAWSFNGDTYSQTLLNTRPNYSTFSMDDLARDYTTMIPGGTIAEWTVPILDTNHPSAGDPEFPSPAKTNAGDGRMIRRLPPNSLGALRREQLGRLQLSNQTSNLRGAITGLDPTTIRSLARLDPYTSGPNYVPLRVSHGPRYVEADNSPFEFSSSAKDVTFTHTSTTDDWRSGTDYKVETHNYSKGWLSFLGLGVSENKTVVATMKCSRQSRTSRMATYQTHASLNAEHYRSHNIHCFYDRAFGTFALEEGPITAVAAFEDTAHDANGVPIANQMVSLNAGGKRFWTRTDAQGRFAFHSAEIAHGPASLQIGTVRRMSVEIKRTQRKTAPGL